MRKFSFGPMQLRGMNNRYKLSSCTKNKKCIGVEAIEIKPSIRVIKYMNPDRPSPQIDNLFLSFPYIQFYVRTEVCFYDDKTHETYDVPNISFSTEPVTPSTQLCYAMLPNICWDDVFGFHALCVGEISWENPIDLVNAFWNGVFNSYFISTFQSKWQNPFARWNCDFNLYNWAKLTEKYGAFALDINWLKSDYTFGEMATGRKR